MSCLDATFTLTPRSPVYSDVLGRSSAYLFCFGTDAGPPSPFDFSSLYASNRFCFEDGFEADPNLDYAQWANRKKTRFLDAFIDLLVGGNKSLALIFGFDVFYTTANPGGACARLLRRRPDQRPGACLWRQSVSPRNRVLGYTDCALLHPRGWVLVFQGNQRLRGLTPAKVSSRLRCMGNSRCGRKRLSFRLILVVSHSRRRGGTGRRAGLKIQ